MSNESEIATRFTEFSGWVSEHWPWLSGSAVAIGYAVKKVILFFRGVNRLADGQAVMAEQIRQNNEEIKDRLSALERGQRKLMDADGVDLRVAPVIQSVIAANDKIDVMREQVSDLYRALLTPKPNGSRPYDPQD